METKSALATVKAIRAFVPDTDIGLCEVCELVRVDLDALIERWERDGTAYTPESNNGRNGNGESNE